jgi:hypothetical protein
MDGLYRTPIPPTKNRANPVTGPPGKYVRDHPQCVGAIPFSVNRV